MLVQSWPIRSRTDHMPPVGPSSAKLHRARPNLAELWPEFPQRWPNWTHVGQNWQRVGQMRRLGRTSSSVATESSSRMPWCCSRAHSTSSHHGARQMRSSTTWEDMIFWSEPDARIRSAAESKLQHGGNPDTDADIQKQLDSCAQNGFGPLWLQREASPTCSRNAAIWGGQAALRI